MKILPTYVILFDRNYEHVIVDVCPRCSKESETWEHMWSCDDNEMSEYDVLIRTLINTEEKYKGDAEKYKAVRTLAKEIVSFIEEDSVILIVGKQKRLRELTRGLFNNCLYQLGRSKVDRELIDEI